jgi:hypothetical protein
MSKEDILRKKEIMDVIDEKYPIEKNFMEGMIAIFMARMLPPPKYARQSVDNLAVTDVVHAAVLKVIDIEKQTTKHNLQNPEEARDLIAEIAAQSFFIVEEKAKTRLPPPSR